MTDKLDVDNSVWIAASACEPKGVGELSLFDDAGASSALCNSEQVQARDVSEAHLNADFFNGISRQASTLGMSAEQDDNHLVATINSSSRSDMCFFLLSPCKSKLQAMCLE